MRRKCLFLLLLVLASNISSPNALIAPIPAQTILHNGQTISQQEIEYSDETEIILTNSQLDKVIHLSTSSNEANLREIEDVLYLQETSWRPILPSPAAMEGIESEWGFDSSVQSEKAEPSVEPTPEPPIIPNSGLLPLCNGRKSSRSCMRRERCDRFIARGRRRRRRRSQAVSTCARNCQAKALACVPHA